MQNKKIVIKATPRFELGIKDLQSSALPFGHAAYINRLYSRLVFIQLLSYNILS
jgi:hypothetical protein